MKVMFWSFAGIGAVMLAVAAGLLVWMVASPGVMGEVLIPIIVLAATGVTFILVGRYADSLDMSATIANGVPGTAQIMSVQDTGVTINSLNMVVKLNLLVTIPGAPSYTAETRTMLSGRTQWGALQPGMTIPVKVDPKDPSRVAVDIERGLSPSEAPPEMVAQAINQAYSAGPAVAAQAGMKQMKAADIIRDGVATSGTLVSVTPTGLTADKAAAGLPAHEADDPLVFIVLKFAGDGGAEQTTQCAVRVPDGKAAFLAAGAEVPVAYLAGRPETATIDWTRLT